jgi:hypothetical protein
VIVLKRRKIIIFSILLCAVFSLPTISLALTFSGPDGLSATADFSLNPDGYDLGIVLTNTSTDIPSGFDNADSLLTSISFDLGSNSIISGIAFTGGSVLSFDTTPPSTGPGGTFDVSQEYGFGNSGTTGLLNNYVSAMEAGTTKFVSGNLDGPDELNGPQAGLSNDVYEAFFGSSNPLGRINDSVTFWLNLDVSLSDLSFLQKGAIVEWGSDAAHTPVPEPATMLLLSSGLLGLAGYGKRKKLFKK